MLRGLQEYRRFFWLAQRSLPFSFSCSYRKYKVAHKLKTAKGTRATVEGAPLFFPILLLDLGS